MLHWGLVLFHSLWISSQIYSSNPKLWKQWKCGYRYINYSSLVIYLLQRCISFITVPTFIGITFYTVYPCFNVLYISPLSPLLTVYNLYGVTHSCITHSLLLSHKRAPPCSTNTKTLGPSLFLPPLLSLAVHLRCWQCPGPITRLLGDVIEAVSVAVADAVAGVCICAARRGLP